jgi:hypothetical protein
MKYVALIGLLLLTACTRQQQIVEKPVFIEKPELMVPSVSPAEQYSVEWHVITKENVLPLIDEFERNGQQFVLFAVTPAGYQNLSLNMAEIRRYIEQQNAVVLAYRDYYKKEQR